LKQDLTASRADLSAHVETLKGEPATLKTQLAGAETRAGEEAAKPHRQSPPSSNWRSGSKRWLRLAVLGGGGS
jgi:hypothetical protein